MFIHVFHFTPAIHTRTLLVYEINLKYYEAAAVREMLNFDAPTVERTQCQLNISIVECLPYYHYVVPLNSLFVIQFIHCFEVFCTSPVKLLGEVRLACQKLRPNVSFALKNTDIEMFSP